jgi:tRNA threonylcarbamoyladenosine biosynthesis protein TsaE
MAADEWLPDVMATEAFGANLAKQLKPGMVVYLQGDLGAGKTTLVRGLLRALGHTGPVKSPTYTLVESYSFDAGLIVHHLDLYRLADPEELEWIGIRDLVAKHAISLIEWPEQGGDMLPPADLTLVLVTEGNGRRVTFDYKQAVP